MTTNESPTPTADAAEVERRLAEIETALADADHPTCRDSEKLARIGERETPWLLATIRALLAERAELDSDILVVERAFEQSQEAVGRMIAALGIALMKRGETGPKMDVLIHAALHSDDTILLSDDTLMTLRDAIATLPGDFNDWKGLARVMDAKPLTTSLDACAVVTERMGWELLVVDMNPDGKRFAMLRNRAGDWRSGIAPTIPAAWAAAILRAKGGER